MELPEEKIFLIGDIHTVNAFKICGIQGVEGNAQTAGKLLESFKNSNEAAIVIITEELAENISKEIKNFNINQVKPVVIEIPGLDSTGLFNKSVISYISEALGISI